MFIDAVYVRLDEFQVANRPIYRRWFPAALNSRTVGTPIRSAMDIVDGFDGTPVGPVVSRRW